MSDRGVVKQVKDDPQYEPPSNKTTWIDLLIILSGLVAAPLILKLIITLLPNT